MGVWECGISSAEFFVFNDLNGFNGFNLFNDLNAFNERQNASIFAVYGPKTAALLPYLS